MAISTNQETGKHILRRTARLVSYLDAHWDVVYVQTPAEAADKVNLAAQRHLIANFKLATEMGAKVVTLKERNVARALANYAKQTEATLIVMGKTRRSFWQQLLYGDLVRQLIDMTDATPTDILVVGL
jgi:two-component system sensor histidine kinase KdpD